MKAIQPALPPVPFEPVTISSATRVRGFVHIPDKTVTGRRSFVGQVPPHLDDDSSSDNKEIGAMSCSNLGYNHTTASSNNNGGDKERDFASPTITSLNRANSVADNILIINKNSSDSSSYLLQRKIAITNDGILRVGFRLKSNADKNDMKEDDDDNGGDDDDDEDLGIISTSFMGWEVIPSSENSSDFPYEIVAIKIQAKDAVNWNETTTTNDDGSETTNHVLTTPIDTKASIGVCASRMISQQNLSGGNVVMTHEMAVCSKHIYTIMPYHKDGSLFDYVGQNYFGGKVPESVAHGFFLQIIHGLESLQQVGLCHRNISLDTILLNGKNCYISSLGCALRVPRDEQGAHLLQPQPPAGRNIQYAAPELFSCEPFDGYAIDLWSAGIVLFVLLFGIETLFAAPFVEDPKFKQICVNGNLRTIIEHHHEEQHLKRQRSSEQGTTPEKAAQNNELPVSEEVVDLLQSMLRADPKDRLDLQQVKDHPWVINK